MLYTWEAFYAELAGRPDFVAQRREILRVRAGLRAKDYQKV